MCALFIDFIFQLKTVRWWHEIIKKKTYPYLLIDFIVFICCHFVKCMVQSIKSSHSAMKYNLQHPIKNDNNNMVIILKLFHTSNYFFLQTSMRNSDAFHHLNWKPMQSVSFYRCNNLCTLLCLSFENCLTNAYRILDQ